MGRAHNPVVRDRWELFQEANRSKPSKILPVEWLLFRWLGTTSGFYSSLSGSALSRCSEWSLGRDSECSNSTTAFLGSRMSQEIPAPLLDPTCDLFRRRTRCSACLLSVPALSYPSEPASHPTSPCFSRATGSRLFLSSSCWTDREPDGKKSSALFLLAFRAQESRAAQAFLRVLPCSPLVSRCQASGKLERSKKIVFV